MVRTGLDRKLSGTFQADYKKFGSVLLSGNLDGTLADPIVHGTMEASEVFYQGIGPIMGSAQVSLVRKIVSVENLNARLKQSEIATGSATLDLQSKRIQAEVPEISVQLEDVLPDGKG